MQEKPHLGANFGIVDLEGKLFNHIMKEL